MAVKPPSGDEREIQCLLDAWWALNRIQNPSPRLKAVCLTLSKLLTQRGISTTRFTRNVKAGVKRTNG